jgi:hypothetical protein
MFRRHVVRQAAIVAMVVLAVTVVLSAPLFTSKPPQESGGGGASFVLAPYRVDHQNPVEQESPNFFDNNCGGNPANPACDSTTWVNNPTNCSWDVDDTDTDMGTGDLAATTTVTATKCVIVDGYFLDGQGIPKGGYVEASINANSASLTVTLASSTGQVWTALPLQQHGGYVYTICHRESGGPYEAIGGSNGGTGRRVDFTLSLSTDNHAARGLFAVFQTYGTRGAFGIACP